MSADKVFFNRIVWLLAAVAAFPAALFTVRLLFVSGFTGSISTPKILVLSAASLTPLTLLFIYKALRFGVTRHFLKSCFSTAAASALIFTGVFVLRINNTASSVLGEDSTFIPAQYTPPTSATISDNTVVDSTQTTVAPSTNPTWAPDGRWNVLLIGTDAGVGRYGARADSILVLSTDIKTGDTALISIPRNTVKAKFPQGTLGAKEFPSGFPDLINAVFGWGMKNKEALGVSSDYAGGAVATAQVVSVVTGLRIDDWITVDMLGFTNLIDALGGVEVCLENSVPLPPAIPESNAPIPPKLGPGCHDLNGAVALAFARSRSADSDYARTARQRLLVEALIVKFSGTNFLSNWQEILNAIEGTVKTSIPRYRVDEANTAFSNIDTKSIRLLGLVPPIFKPSDYDIKETQILVFQFVYFQKDPA